MLTVAPEEFISGIQFKMMATNLKMFGAKRIALREQWKR